MLPSQSQWDLHHVQDVCRRMQVWGITDRLRKVTLGPMRSLLLEDNHIHSDDNCTFTTWPEDVVIQQPSSLETTSREISPLSVDLILSTHHPPITPASIPYSNVIRAYLCNRNTVTNIAPKIAPRPLLEREQTEEEKKEQERRRKEEKRRIQKRLAAQRANDRRAAERKRNRMLQIKKN